MSENRLTYIGPSRLTDEEYLFMAEILVLLQYSDPGYTIKICRKPEEIIAHITPSSSAFKGTIVENLLHFNRVKKARIRFSSSLKISSTISFTISLHESILSATLAKNT